MGLITMCLSWLLPNKEYPWLPAWNEGLAFAAVLILWIVNSGYVSKNRLKESGISWPVLVFSTLAIIVVWVQYGAGLLIFSGDAFLVSLYFLIFLIAIRVGGVMATSREEKKWMNALIAALVISTVISIGIALIQWTHTWNFAIFLMETGIGDRPGANLGQINNFNTLCFVSVCGVLYLYRQNNLRLSIALLAGLFLTFGMALTQSRTGWLQIIFLSGFVLLSAKNTKTKFIVLIFAAVFFSWYISIPLIESRSLISADQHYRDLPINDVRVVMWSALIEAAAMRPWGGYGWLQTGWAQQVTAESIPILRSYMSYSHNFALDLVIWTGWPIAIVLVGLLAIWFLKHLVFRNNESEMFLYCAVVGIFIHGLLEYPLSYAYFLMPAGLMMGYLDGARPVFKRYIFSYRYQFALFIVTVSLYLLVCADYMKAVSVDVAVRMRSAQIARGTDTEKIDTKFIVLNQLEAMYDVRLMPVDGYKSEDLMLLMTRVVQRYPYSPALFQYAWMRAMRGENSAAEKQLRVLCGIYSEAHCQIIENRWKSLQKEYPGTVGLVNFPDQSVGDGKNKFKKSYK